MNRKTCFSDNNNLKLWYEWQTKVQHKEPVEKLQIKKCKQDGKLEIENVEFGNYNKSEISTSKMEMGSTVHIEKQRHPEDRNKNTFDICVRDNLKTGNSRLIEDDSEYSNLKEDSRILVTRWRRFPLQNKDGNDDAVFLSLNKST